MPLVCYLISSKSFWKMYKSRILLKLFGIGLILANSGVHCDCVGKYKILTSVEYREVPPYSIDGFDTVPTNVTWQNNGQTVVLNYKFDNKRPSISGGPFHNETFILDFMYYHWRNKSRYQVEPEVFPAELHVVFINKRFASYEEAIRKDLGVVVLTYLHTIIDDDYENGMDIFYDPIERIQKPNASVTVPGSNTPYIFNIVDMDPYYITYKGKSVFGSNPICGGEIIWMEFVATLEIKLKQIKAFRQLMALDRESLINKTLDYIAPSSLVVKAISPIVYREKNWTTYPFNGYEISYELDAKEYQTNSCLGVNKISAMWMIFIYIAMMIIIP